MTRKVNIDQRLAAKSEINREPVEVVFRDRTWSFAPSLPAQLPELMAEGKIVAGLLLALAPEQRDDFSQLAVTMDEVGAIVEVLAEIYGTTPGESTASE
jgi:hypothetical protein